MGMFLFGAVSGLVVGLIFGGAIWAWLKKTADQNQNSKP